MCYVDPIFKKQIVHVVFDILKSDLINLSDGISISNIHNCDWFSRKLLFLFHG